MRQQSRTQKLMAALFKVGLTGGIACGKSTVVRRWVERGGPSLATIDTDELAHRALEPNTPTWQEVVATFGKTILNDDRTVDRARLGEMVFADEQKRLALNRIVHPAVARMWMEAVGRLERDGQARIVVVTVPLLYEVGAEKEFDCIVAVGCSEATQLARLTANGLNETQARARIRAQWPLQLKMDRADYVIWNNCTLPKLWEQADMIWATIKEINHAPSKN
jgi:dephospho-CoA kinase